MTTADVNPHIEPHTTGKSPEQLLNIKDAKSAQDAIMMYGLSPSMLYDMNKADRAAFARALVKGCRDQGLDNMHIPPLWLSILEKPDYHEEAAQRYRNR